MESLLLDDKKVIDQITCVEIMARKDQEYMALLEECLSLEDAFLEVMQEIAPRQAGVIYDFFSAYSDLQEFRLKIACHYTHLPE